MSRWKRKSALWPAQTSGADLRTPSTVSCLLCQRSHIILTVTDRGSAEGDGATPRRRGAQAGSQGPGHKAVWA